MSSECQQYGYVLKIRLTDYSILLGNLKGNLPRQVAAV
jgi:hypothetical protein